MKRYLCLLLVLLTVDARAYFQLNTINLSNKTRQGAITDPLIEITPKGLYAEVAMTFTINVASPEYSNADSIEAILDFNLPPNSFVHDSWLWLDNVNIIRASIIERGAATQIFESFIKRRKDPSLLTKTGNTYKLRVFPLLNSYPRKVKIVYSTPFQWNDKNFIVPLPIKIFKATANIPDLKVNIKYDAFYTQPSSFEVSPLNITASSAIEKNVLIKSQDYKSLVEMNMTYNVNSNNLFVGYYPMNSNEGIYQLAVNPVMQANYAPRNITVVVDQVDNLAMTKYSVSAIKQYLKGFLLSNYNPLDSFNLFYYNSSVAQAFTKWTAMTPANIIAAADNMSVNTASINSKQLLLDAISFCKTKPAANANIVLFSANSQYYANAAAITYVNDIKALSGAAFTNKIHVVSNSMGNSSNVMFQELANASGGIFTNIDSPGTIKWIPWYQAAATSNFSVTMPVNGVTYSEYDINSSGQLSASMPYIETGKYYGTLSTGTDVEVKYVTSSGLLNKKYTINALNPGSDNMMKAWVNKFIDHTTMINNNQYTRELLDSSIHNRVLCELTAFLALENGDTINSSKSDVVVGSPGTELEFAL